MSSRRPPGCRSASGPGASGGQVGTWRGGSSGGEALTAARSNVRTSTLLFLVPPLGPVRSHFLLFWVALPLQGAPHPIPGGQAGVRAVRVPVQGGVPVPGGAHPGGGGDGGQTGLGAVFASVSSCLKRRQEGCGVPGLLSDTCTCAWPRTLSVPCSPAPTWTASGMARPTLVDLATALPGLARGAQGSSAGM